MPLYSISDLERISATKAHTIRIWEQRYNLLEPERTDTNIRVYNDAQLRKLLKVCTLLSTGYKISQVSKMTPAQLKLEIDQVIAGPSNGDLRLQAILNEFVIAVSTYDIAAFERLYADASQRFGLGEMYQRVLYPLLVRTGLMWVKDDLLPAQEHFLSNLVRQKIFSAMDALPLAAHSDQKWILFLNENEHHEIGLLFASYLIRFHGQHVIYLGARVPYSDLSSVVSHVQPTHIYTFFVNPFSEEDGALLNRLANDFTGTTLCLSGGGEKAASFAESAQLVTIGTIERLIEILSEKYGK